MRKAGCAYTKNSFSSSWVLSKLAAAKRNVFPFFPRGGKKIVSQTQGKLLKGLVLVYLQRMGADEKLFIFFSPSLFSLLPSHCQEMGKKERENFARGLFPLPRKKGR